MAITDSDLQLEVRFHLLEEADTSTFFESVSRTLTGGTYTFTVPPPMPVHNDTIMHGYRFPDMRQDTARTHLQRSILI